MNPSLACYDLVRDAEGCKLKAYRDSKGVLTIGTGHTKGVFEGQVITTNQAEQFLESDMAEAADAVNRLATPCTQNQFDALTSFTFNEGEGHLSGSHLLLYHKAGEYAKAAAQFGSWIYCNHEILEGLVKRRAAEAHLYLSEEAS